MLLMSDVRCNALPSFPGRDSGECHQMRDANVYRKSAIVKRTISWMFSALLLLSLPLTNVSVPSVNANDSNHGNQKDAALVTGQPGAMYDFTEKSVAAANNPFEGSITLSRYTVRADGSEHWVSSTPLLIHPDYILLIQSEGGSVEILGNIRAEGIIVRQGREDFVFLTSDRKAVIMTRQELQQMIAMLDSMRGRASGEQQEEPDVSFKSTGERKQVEGYQAEKWIASQEGSSSEWHFWVTDQLSIPWGLLSEQWLTKQLSLSGLPAERWFVNEMLPVRAELWANGELAEIIKIKDITPQSIPESRFQIPGDYQRITFQQMLFDRMRNR